MKEITIEIPFGFAWKFVNIPNEINNIELKKDQKIKLSTDFNIAIDKASSKTFLKQLEFLARENINICATIPTKQTPAKSPHYIDNENSFITYEKKSFRNIIIKRIKIGKYVSIEDNSLILEFGDVEIYELFTRMYINFEIYAVHEGNVISVKDRNSNKKVRLVIWGAINGKPIQY